MPSDGGEEAVAPRVPPVPAKPTQAEQDELYATGHAAYRSWCEHCVRGRGRVSPHVSVSEGELPEVGVDYASLGPEGSQVTILVCKCKRTGCLAATPVPEKGMNAYALAFFAGWLRGLGWKRLLLRSDNGRALLAFLRAAAASLEGVEVIEQASPEGDHAANGLAEVGVREVKAQTRVLKSHLEERLKRQLDWSEPWQHGWFDTQRIACRDTEFKQMGRRRISDAQESVGGVKLLNSEKKQHFYWSPHVVKVEWQVMRRE